jgi:hypothetical protein
LYTQKNEDEFLFTGGFEGENEGEGYDTYVKPRQDRRDAPSYNFDEGDAVTITNPAGLVSWPLVLFGRNTNIKWPEEKASPKSVDGGEWVETWYQAGFTGIVVHKVSDCERHFPILLAGDPTVCYLVRADHFGMTLTPEVHHILMVDVKNKGTMEPNKDCSKDGVCDANEAKAAIAKSKMVAKRKKVAAEQKEAADKKSMAERKRRSKQKAAEQKAEYDRAARSYKAERDAEKAAKKAAEAKKGWFW